MNEHCTASHEVVYLTGPPATGKTTLVNHLMGAFSNLRTFIYSQLLSDHVSRRDETFLSQEALRAKSGRIVAPADVLAVDRYLIREVAKARLKHHVLIDSHPVTKEAYGFRVTAFSVPLLHSLRPTRICMLYTTPESVIQRIKREPKGRPPISKFEANFHCFTQMAVATSYSIQLGVPIYFYDASVSVEVAFQEISKRFSQRNRRIRVIKGN